MVVKPADPHEHGAVMGQRPSRAKLFAALPRLSGSTVAMRNRMYQAPAFMVSGDMILIWQDVGAMTSIGELACRVGTAPLSVSADSLSRLEPRLEGFESFVPTDTCTALVEHALTPVLQLLERLSGIPIECDEFRRGPPIGDGPDGVNVGFTLLESSAKLLLRGRVRTTIEAWQSMDLKRAVSMAPQRQFSVPVRLSIELGRCRLMAREVALLAPGDALRPASRIDRYASSLPLLLTNISGRFAIAARVLGDELILEKPVSNDVDTSPPSVTLDDPSQSNAGYDLLNEIECELSFELGSMRLTVADIARMRAGQTMRLGVRLQEQPVRLLVNGRLIGRGELAAVGDEMVVVVTDTSRLPTV